MCSAPEKIYTAKQPAGSQPTAPPGTRFSWGGLVGFSSIRPSSSRTARLWHIPPLGQRSPIHLSVPIWGRPSFKSKVLLEACPRFHMSCFSCMACCDWRRQFPSCVRQEGGLSCCLAAENFFSEEDEECGARLADSHSRALGMPWRRTAPSAHALWWARGLLLTRHGEADCCQARDSHQPPQLPHSSATGVSCPVPSCGLTLHGKIKSSACSVMAMRNPQPGTSP